MTHDDPSFLVRDERLGDAPAIHAVHVAAFPSEAEACLVDRLRTHGRVCVSLVAVCGDDVVGHVCFSPVWLEGEGGGRAGVGLAPIAVADGCRRRGIGAALVRAGIERCRQLGVGFVVVLGEPAYYGRFGFLKAHDYGIGNEYGADGEFQVLELSPGALIPGVAKYGLEFETGPSWGLDGVELPPRGAAPIRRE